MQIKKLDLPGLLLLTPRVFEDSRGQFSETFNARTFKDATGLDIDFVQDNESFSRFANTIRGLHFQTPPHAQSKLFRVISGRVIDVAVDIRMGSPTFGQSVSLQLSGDRAEQVFVPKGFLHGFRTLEPDTRVAYKVDAFYSPDCDRSIQYNDPAIACDWGLSTGDEVHLSDKDQNARPFSDAEGIFTYEGPEGATR